MNFPLNEMVNMAYVLDRNERNPLLTCRFYAQRFPDRKHPRERNFGKVQGSFEQR